MKILMVIGTVIFVGFALLLVGGLVYESIQDRKAEERARQYADCVADINPFYGTASVNFELSRCHDLYRS